MQGLWCGIDPQEGCLQFLYRIFQMEVWRDLRGELEDFSRNP